VTEEPTISLAGSKGRRTLDRVGGFTTSIGPDNILSGSLSGSGHCIVLGTVEGDSEMGGTVVIGDSGRWTGNITAETVIIAGQVHGAVVARKKMEIVSTARVHGSLTSPFIAIAEGAVHEGEIHMAEVKRFTDQRESD
jgi:cytoskeletal protein CcmA (bactofilin family)